MLKFLKTGDLKEKKKSSTLSEKLRNMIQFAE